MNKHNSQKLSDYDFSFRLYSSKMTVMMILSITMLSYFAGEYLEKSTALRMFLISHIPNLSRNAEMFHFRYEFFAICLSLNGLIVLIWIFSRVKSIQQNNKLIKVLYEGVMALSIGASIVEILGVYLVLTEKNILICISVMILIILANGWVEGGKIQKNILMLIEFGVLFSLVIYGIVRMLPDYESFHVRGRYGFSLIEFFLVFGLMGAVLQINIKILIIGFIKSIKNNKK